MTESTPRERLEFSISNKPPMVGVFNGKPISIERIKLSEIKETWSEVVKIMRTAQNHAMFARSKGGGDPESDDSVAAADGLFDTLEELGPGAINIIHTFIKASTDSTDEMLDDADFWSLAELVVLILEHNVGPDLMDFFGRGASVLRTLNLLPESPDTKGNNTSSSEDGAPETSTTSTPVNSNAD